MALGSGVNNVICGIAAIESSVYVGGYFTTTGGNPSSLFGIYQNELNGIEEKLIISDLQPLFKLKQNVPNPFTQGTTINYQLQKAGHVSLNVYNITGQVVRTLVAEVQNVGSYSVVWNGRDDDGKSVSTGLYFYRLSLSGINDVKRLVLIK